MNQDVSTRLSRCTLLVCAGLWSVVSCSATQPARQGTDSPVRSQTPEQWGSSIAQEGDPIAQQGGPIAQNPECNQTDSTVSCCLKRHPGEYERCGAMAPKQPPKPPPKEKPTRLPPLTDLTPEEAREREEMCRDIYYRCLDLGGAYEKRGMYGKSICQSCWQRCKAEGYWPQEVNDFPCLGGSQ